MTNLQIWVDEFGEGVMAMFMPFEVPSGNEVLVRTNAGPTIAGSGQVNTPHVVTPGTFNLTPPPLTYEWLIDSIVVATGTGYTPPVTVVDKAVMQVRETVTGLPSLTSTSLAVPIINSATVSWPANIAASKVLKIGEITDSTDPNVGSGTRREIQMDTFTIPTDFTFWVNSSPLDGAQMTGASQLTGAGGAAGYKRWNNALPIGDTTWVTGFWRHEPTQTSQHAFGLGATGDGKALTGITGDTGHGQLVVTIAGIDTDPPPPLPTDWPNVSVAARDDALTIPLTNYFETSPGSGQCNATQFGHAAVTLAIRAYHGDTSIYDDVKLQINELLSKSPLANGGVPAQHENYFMTFFVVLRQTPAIWGNTSYITAPQKSQVDCIMEAIMYDACFMGSDNHPYLNGSWRSQRGDALAVSRSVGGDISFGVIARLQTGAAWFGTAAAKTMVNNMSRATFRAKCLSVLGSSSNVYRTVNWRNLGYTTDPTNIMGGLSANAPTDTQFEAALHPGGMGTSSWRYDGITFDNFEGQLCDANFGYMQKMLPPYNSADASHATRKYWGWTQYGLRGNVGINDGSGPIRGIIASGGSAMPAFSGAFASGPPPAGTEQRMWFDLNGQDEGGTPPTGLGGARSSMSYSCWDRRMFENWAICMEMLGAWDRTTPRMLDLLQKSFDAVEVHEYFSSKGYNSYSHGGTKGGGAGGPEVWPIGGPTEYHMMMNLSVSDVIRGKLGY